MPMWSDLPDQADLDDRRAARAERQARSRRTRLQRLSVTVTTLSLIAVGGVVVLTRPAAEITPTAAVVAPQSAAPSASPSAAEVDAKLRDALATGSGEAPAVTDAAPAPSASATSEPPAEESATPAPRAAAAAEESSALPAESLPVATEGDYGSVIEVAQRALDVEPTGYFGPKTKAAVAEYQEAIGLPATGQIATFTWSALGSETVAAALEAAATADGYTAGEPAQIQEAPDPESTPRSNPVGDPPVLEETDSGESVAVVQRALGVKPATGYFGPLTSKAVKQFQANNGIPTTGVIATFTWGALGKETATKAATAHAAYGTVFGPGAAPSSSSSSSSNSGSNGSKKTTGNSGSSNSGGNSGGGNSGGAGGSGGLFCPVKNFYYGDGLGAPRPGGRSHAGLDLMGKRGEPIYAIDSGKVTRSGYQSNGSLILDITGSRGMYFYGHFDKILVGYGQSVKAGQLIGYMGDTGSPGAVHLHLEVRPNGWSGGYSDPVPLIKSLCGR
jgi:peptidoglycan hydrolase-like protein with peptidoglycan-binding domain